MAQVAPDPLVLQLLEWLSARPRTYGETIEAWRTSCPRMPVWEDALGGGLVETGGGGALSARPVRVTEAGRRRLANR